MNASDLATLEAHLSPEERKELMALVMADIRDKLWSPLPGPQQMAYDSIADVIGFGGSAGGGKTDLAIGKAIMQHRVAFVVRKNGTEHTGMVDRLTELLGTRDGFSSKDGIWRGAGPRGVQIEFGSLPNPKDEEKYRGRPHDLIIYDEATSLTQLQVEFLMAWNRTTTPGQRCQTLLTFNPPSTAEGRWVIEYFAPWLDTKHPNPAMPGELRWFAVIDGQQTEMPDGTPFMHKGELITPRSRTFIPSRISDNPYLVGTGYMSQLQALPEPLRSQMLYGSFTAGVQDDPWQVIPTSWVEEAQARWKKRAPKGEMLAIGVDVARGGQDKTSIATRHVDDNGKGMWFDEPHEYPGSQTPDGPKVAGLTIAHRRDDAPIHIDAIGVGASPYDVLNGMRLNVIGVNVAEKARGTDRSGKLRFFNQRSELWWHMREALDPANDTGIALPPTKKLLSELCAPKWEASGYTVKVESRDDIIKRIGHSPDMATAYILALMETPKVSFKMQQQSMEEVLSYDPMASRG
jgi:hypothetical protein